MHHSIGNSESIKKSDMVSSNSKPEKEKSRIIPGLLFLALLWLQFCFVLAPSWEEGTYYDYGWLALPVIAFLSYQRWLDPVGLPSKPRDQIWVRLLIALGVLSLFPIRVVQHVDIYWRLPLWIHAGLLLGITHLTVGLLSGWRRSSLLMPATFLILVAVPLPTAIEGALVRTLTQTVLELAANLLPMMGYPAIIAGSAFIVDGQLLDVAEGCSGIRSFQGCIMAALALGELRRFRPLQRLSLLVLALVIAVIANATRIIILTRLTYTEGHAAMDEAHDTIGIWTAVVTYSLIGVLAWLLGLLSRQKGRTVSRKVVNPPNHHSVS